MKMQKYMISEKESPRSVGVQYATWEECANSSRKMKRLGQSGNDAQLWLYLVVTVKYDAVKCNIAQKPGLLGPLNQHKLDEVKQEMAKWTPTFQESVNYNGREWVNFVEMTIISTTIDRNPVEEMEQPSQSIEEPEMQYLDAVSKMKLLSQFVLKVNYSASQYAPTTDAEETEVE